MFVVMVASLLQQGARGAVAARARCPASAVSLPGPMLICSTGSAGRCCSQPRAPVVSSIGTDLRHVAAVAHCGRKFAVAAVASGVVCPERWLRLAARRLPTPTAPCALPRSSMARALPWSSARLRPWVGWLYDSAGLAAAASPPRPVASTPVPPTLHIPPVGTPSCVGRPCASCADSASPLGALARVSETATGPAATRPCPSMTSRRRSGRPPSPHARLRSAVFVVLVRARSCHLASVLC